MREVAESSGSEEINRIRTSHLQADPRRHSRKRVPLCYQEDTPLFLNRRAGKLHQTGKKEKNFRPIIDRAAAVEILNNRLDSQPPPLTEF